MPISIGARLRYPLDRAGKQYKVIYKQRTATERINSQAKALGFERPPICIGKAIANLNILFYVPINSLGFSASEIISLKPSELFKNCEPNFSVHNRPFNRLCFFVTNPYLTTVGPTFINLC